MTQEKRVAIFDLEMPKAVVLRRIKHAVDGKPFQKEAKLALTRAVTVFISYLTAHAVEEADGHQRPVSITSAMLRNALSRVGLGELEDEINSRMQRHLAYTRMRAKQRTALASIAQESGVEDEDEEREEEEEEDEDEEEEEEGKEKETDERGGGHGDSEKVEIEGKVRGNSERGGRMAKNAASRKQSVRLAKSLSRSSSSRSLPTGRMSPAPARIAKDEATTEDESVSYGGLAGGGRHDGSTIDNITGSHDLDGDTDDDDDGPTGSDNSREERESEGEGGGEETQMY